jgi:hypothetical protein
MSQHDQGNYNVDATRTIAVSRKVTGQCAAGWGGCKSLSVASPLPPATPGRAWQQARVALTLATGAMPTEREELRRLQERRRVLIENGTLPRKPPQKRFAGPPLDRHTCIICGRSSLMARSSTS